MSNKYYSIRVLRRDIDWRMDARCRGEDAELFFTHPYPDKRALAICRQCPVRLECLEDALEFEGEVNRHFRAGVWGGMGAADRARLARDRRLA